MSKPGKKDNFRSQFSYCWLSLTLVVLAFKNLIFRLKYVLQYSVKRKYQNIQKIVYSDYCKNWLLCSILDIYRYYWLQAITNSFANLFIFFRWQITGTKIIQFWNLTVGMTIFQTPSACPNQGQVQTLEKTRALFTHPLWKSRPCASPECETVLI